jgi:TPR repeat protein
VTRRRILLLTALLGPLLMGAAPDDTPALSASPGSTPRGITLPGIDLPRPTQQDIEQLQRAATGGDAAALFKLGQLAGRAGDATAAFEAMRRAADQHFHPAEAALAEMLYRGFGTDPDPPRAAIMARRAADAGDSDGQQVPGWLFAIGAGVEQSWPDAVRWASQAATQGNARTQHLRQAVPAPVDII